MRMSSKEFKAWDQKAITLLGMSGVGKTRLACMLRRAHWFHYSGDYRIGTRYLDEAILDNIKQKMMEVPFLRDLMRSDSLYVRNNITVDNLEPVSTFLGKLGNPEKQGLELTEFKRRQTLHRLAEIAAMKDVPNFIDKAHHIYGYDHVVNDAGGSVCELDDDDALQALSEHTLIIYIEASGADKQALIERAESSPKPLYYRDSFLNERLAIYLAEKRLDYVALIDPDDFARWVFPALLHSRLPRYEAIAEQYGYTVTTQALADARDEGEFLELIAETLAA